MNRLQSYYILYLLVIIVALPLVIVACGSKAEPASAGLGESRAAPQATTAPLPATAPAALPTPAAASVATSPEATSLPQDSGNEGAIEVCWLRNPYRRLPRSSVLSYAPWI